MFDERKIKHNSQGDLNALAFGQKVTSKHFLIDCFAVTFFQLKD